MGGGGGKKTRTHEPTVVGDTLHTKSVEPPQKNWKNGSTSKWKENETHTHAHTHTHTLTYKRHVTNID